MYKGKRILGIIPARSGSKGLPGKNIMILNGKPLVHWSIHAAQESSLFSEITVNTDDEEIAARAAEAGATIPFLRPAALASDTASTIDALLYGLDWYKKNGKEFDVLVLLQPTSPLRTAKDIRAAVDLFIHKNALSVVSVCEVDHHPYWMNTLPDDLDMKDFLHKEAVNTPRQSLPTFYRLNGAIYVAEVNWLIENKNFFGDRTYAYMMDKDRSVDIDTLIDFQLAELLLTTKK